MIERLVVGGLARRAGAQHHRGAPAQAVRKVQSGVGDRLARGDHGELRETVEQIEALGLEAVLGKIAADLRPDLHMQLFGGAQGNRAEFRSTPGQAAPERAGVEPQGRDTPIPVMATRRIPFILRRKRAFRPTAPLDSLDHVPHTAKTLGVFVGHPDIEFALDREKQVEPMKRVDL